MEDFKYTSMTDKKKQQIGGGGEASHYLNKNIRLCFFLLSKN